MQIMGTSANHGHKCKSWAQVQINGTSTHSNRQKRMHEYTCTLHAHLHGPMCSKETWIHTKLHPYTQTCTRTHARVRCIFTCVHINKHTHAHTQTHTHEHTHTNTHTLHATHRARRSHVPNSSGMKPEHSRIHAQTNTFFICLVIV